MHTLDTNIINKHFPELLPPKYLYLLYMSCNTFYKEKLNEEELEKIYYTPKTNDELKKTVNKWYKTKNKHTFDKGHISRWNTKYITDMSDTFCRLIYYFYKLSFFPHL